MQGTWRKEGEGGESEEWHKGKEDKVDRPWFLPTVDESEPESDFWEPCVWRKWYKLAFTVIIVVSSRSFWGRLGPWLKDYVMIKPERDRLADGRE